VALGLLLGTRDAEAAVPGTVAVVELEDPRGGLSAESRARLSTHLRVELGRGGTSVVAVAGNGPALKAVAPAALVTTLVVVGRRFVLVAELRDLETQAVLAQARGEVDVPEGVSPERHLRSALTDLTAQLRGELPPGQLRPLPPGEDSPPEPSPDPVEPEPVEPVEPAPVPVPRDENHYAIQPGVFARAARFTGLLQVSLATNHADEHYGPLQLAGWRNEAGTFVGALQLSLRQNKIDEEFYGIAQVSLLNNDAVGFTGVAQLGPRNDARSFTGVGQVGLLNMVGDGDRGGDDERYFGLVQAGVVNVHHHPVYTLAQGGLAALGGRAPMNAGVSVSAASLLLDGSFFGGAQLGAVTLTGNDFTGLVQAGALAGTMRTFSGLAQIGLVAYVGNNLYREIFGVHVENRDNDHETFRGLVQAGALAMTDHELRALLHVGAIGTYVDTDAYALAQVGTVNYVGKSFYGFAQLGGANLVDEFSGFLQAGLVSYTGRDFYGGQIGVVNLARRAHGVQIGLLNVSEKLYGVQLGLVNVASDNGLLPITGLANVGF